MNFLTVTVNTLRVEHKSAKLLVAGDRNKLPIEDLLKVLPDLTQIVDKPTRKDSILDIVLTDIPELFTEVTIIPPVDVDKDGVGVPSNHKGVLVEPIGESEPTRTKRKTIEVQQINDHK